MAEKVKLRRDKMSALLILMLAGHGFFGMAALLITGFAAMVANGFKEFVPLFDGRGFVPGPRNFEYGMYLEDFFITLTAIFTFLILLSVPILFWLLLRRKKACVALTLAAALFEAGMLCSIFLLLFTTKVEWETHISAALILLPYMTVPGLSCFGLKSLKSWLADPASP